MAPTRPDIQLALAHAYHSLGQHTDGVALCEEVAARDPEAVEARWLACLYRIPVSYRSPEEPAACRAAYADALERLSATLNAGSHRDWRRLARVAGSAYPFYLAYQGENDLDLQRLHGAMMARALAESGRDWPEAPLSPPPAAGERIRVGIVTGHLHRHVIWEAITRAWVSGLDPARFDLHIFAVGNKRDEVGEAAQRYSARVITGPHGLEAWRNAILSHRLHLLLYPEIGEHGVSARLALQRLAPVQAVSAGHCVTSGFPHMDYFLSSDAMEPADGDAHYSERLVRLPNLGFGYPPPPAPPRRRTRADFGLDREAVLYLSPHMLCKYLPRDDHVYAEIAARVDNSRIVFVRHPKAEALTLQFQRRLEAAFATRGLDWSRHVVFLDRLAAEDYADLQSHCDVFLDAIGWNGGTTTAAALGHALPVVTLAGKLMRGRMGAAMLGRLGLTELIATDAEGYVAAAVRLGQDTAWRRNVGERLAATKHRLYDDAAPLAALESFIVAAVAGRG